MNVKKLFFVLLWPVIHLILKIPVLIIFGHNLGTIQLPLTEDNDFDFDFSTFPCQSHTQRETSRYLINGAGS